MSIIKYLIRLQKKPIVVNNFLLNYYVRSVRRKVDQNHKNSVFDYIVLFGFFLTITVFGICLKTDDNNMKARLYLFDITLMIGGLRQYTLYILILIWTFSSLQYKYFHLTRDNKMMKWLDVLDYIIGRKTLADLAHLEITEEQDNFFKFIAKISVNVSVTLFILIGKLDKS